MRVCSFTPKEHIAGNAPMKSSAQRQIRAKLLEQIPFLSQPAALPSTSSSTAVAAQSAPTAPQSDDEDDEDSGKKKGKGGKKGKGAGPGGKGGKKGKKHDVEDEPATGVAEEGTAPAVDEELTVLDLIWPKKETLSLIKWCVRRVFLSFASVLTAVAFSRSREHISIYAVHGEPLFFQHFDGPFYPTLKILHRCACGRRPPLAPTVFADISSPRAVPDMLPRVGVDRGAIKFVLSGANIMWCVAVARSTLKHGEQSRTVVCARASQPRSPLPFHSPGMTSATGYLPPSSANIPKGRPVAVHAYGKENALAIGLLAMSTDEIREINKNIGVENITFLGDDLWKVERL